LLYKPWRRRIDKKRVRNAHFEPLAQDPTTAQRDDEELQDSLPTDRNGAKDLNINVEPVEATDIAGPAAR
jgi:high-affinity nickel-transport protein